MGMNKWFNARKLIKDLSPVANNMTFRFVLTFAIFLSHMPFARAEIFDTHYNVSKQQLQSFYTHHRQLFNNVFEADVTSDGYPDLFVGSFCGTGICNYICYKNNTDGTYSYAGSLDLKENFFEISPENHGGFNDILMYRHYSAEEVLQIRYRVLEKEYVVVDQQVIGFDNVENVSGVTISKLNW